MSVFIKGFQVFLLGLFVITISACSSTPKEDEGYKGIYDAKTTSDYSLEVPPDLVSPSVSNALVIPGVANSGASFSEYSSSSPVSASSSVLPRSTSGARFVRDGGLFWLEIEANPDEVWQQVRAFFMDLGFSFVTESPVNGLLETNWLENRFDVPTGWIASMLGGLFSTGMMDKYRIRLERSDKDDNVSLLFITHQGLKEHSAGGYYAETELVIKWLPRESDPELEAEMLQRFLVFRGIAKAQARQIVSKGKNIERAKLVKADDNSYVIEVNEIFPRTWRRISIALDRMGLVVEDRDRSKGIYYIKTTEGFVQGDHHEPGWFESLFASKTEQLQIAQFQLKVDDLDNITRVTILNAVDEQDKSKTGLFILEELKAHLN